MLLPPATCDARPGLATHFQQAPASLTIGIVSIPNRPNLQAAAPIDVSSQPDCDVLIAGAGIIGLSLALELHRRGAHVIVLEAAHALQQASSAAAGMLAVHDPHNPSLLLPLARLSASLYPEFLRRIESFSSLAVPLQTQTTIQHLTGGRTTRLAEHSLDPRQLAAALLAAVRASAIDLCENSPLQHTEEHPRGVTAVTAAGDRFTASALVYAMGAWALPACLGVHRLPVPIRPRKGQMLRVQLPTHTPLTAVHRGEHIYVVPRTFGPQAGTALIGATVEDAGFDTVTHAHDLAHLRTLAAELVPELAAETDAPMVEAWAGLRPFTPDGLPLLGRIGNTAQFLAAGHFRNGILLAPATAIVLADLIESKPPTLDLSAFAPQRFS
jgi:glycine oxidase